MSNLHYQNQYWANSILLQKQEKYQIHVGGKEMETKLEYYSVNINFDEILLGNSLRGYKY